ncbi:MAG: hypothetical protein R2688_02825 [Fimbriimonadaceae bacterium]
MAGDTPFAQRATLASLSTSSKNPVPNAFWRLSPSMIRPGYGRILRDEEGKVTGIVEHKDASDDQRAIRKLIRRVLL